MTESTLQVSQEGRYGSFYSDFIRRLNRLRFDVGYRRRRLHEVLAELGVGLEERRVLDFGFGAGELLASFPPTCTLYGVDVSASAVEAARRDSRFARHAGAHFFLSSDDHPERGLPDVKVDVAITSHTLEHVPNDAVMLAALGRCLEPGGTLVVFVPIEEPDYILFHRRSYSLQTITERVEQAGFELLRVEGSMYVNGHVWRLLTVPSRRRWPVVGPAVDVFRGVCLGALSYRGLRGLDRLLYGLGFGARQALVVARRPGGLRAALPMETSPRGEVDGRADGGESAAAQTRAKESPADQRPPLERLGAGNFWCSVRLALGAFVGSVVLLGFLFFRPTPYGDVFVIDWAHFFFHAVWYQAMGALVLSSPFLWFWLFRFRRSVTPRASLVSLVLLGSVLTLSMVIDQVNHELMRFMGTRLTLSFLRTYSGAGPLPTVSKAIGTDAGGVGVPVILLLVPLLFAAWAAWQIRRELRRSTPPPRRTRTVALWTVLPFVVMLVIYHLPGGRFRIAKVRPLFMTWIAEIINGIRGPTRPADLARLVADYQSRWLAEDRAASWRFDDADYPLLRTPTSGATSLDPWNIVYIQLESFRAWNMGLYRPGLEPTPTPFLDGLARSSGGAYWTRAYSFGPPTIAGFFAGHCSILPHSRRNVVTDFTMTRFYSLPDALRRQGYRAEFFTGSDPDWDNERFWLQRWYDAINYVKRADEDDRILFADAAARAIELGRSGRPFLLTVASISNHYPFVPRDSSAASASQGDPKTRISSTMRFTDRVVERFISTLEGEPWFARTLVVVVGDHGYNLGEHETPAGQRNLFRESTWVPLIIYGNHPQLPKGGHDEVASLLDVAPTLASLVGIAEPAPWMGHDLTRGPQPSLGHVHEGMLFVETPRFSVAIDADTPARLFDAADLLQLDDRSREHANELDALVGRTEREQSMVDYLIEVGRVYPE